MKDRLRHVAITVMILPALVMGTPRLAMAQIDPITVAAGIFKTYLTLRQKQQQQQERALQTKEFREKVLGNLAELKVKLDEISTHLVEMSIFLEQEIHKIPLRLYQDEVAGQLVDLNDNWDEITSTAKNREQAVRKLTELLGGLSAASRQTTPPVPYAAVLDVAYLEAATYTLIHFDSDQHYPYPADVKRIFLDYRQFFDDTLGNEEGSISQMHARLLNLQAKAAALIAQMPTSGEEVVAKLPAGNGWLYRAGEVIARGKDGFYTIELISTVNGYVVLTVGNDLVLTDQSYDAYVRKPESLPVPHDLWQQNSPSNTWPERRAMDSITQQAHELNTLVQLERRVTQDLNSLGEIEILAKSGRQLANESCCK